MSTLFPLSVQGAETTRRGKRLVGPVDLDLSGEASVAVMGPNGAGKTTLLQLLHGTARLTGGTVRWACGLAEARAQQAFVFQQPIVLRRSVLDNIAYPVRLRGVPRDEARAQASDWAHKVGLGKMLTRPATVLSGGEKQKLAIARALITAPKLLFLDEPTAALDSRAMAEIEAILQDAKARGAQILFSTHNFGQARRLADRVIFINHGKIVETQGVEGFFEAPQTPQARAFLQGDIVE